MRTGAGISDSSVRHWLMNSLYITGEAQPAARGDQLYNGCKGLVTSSHF